MNVTTGPDLKNGMDLIGDFSRAVAELEHVLTTMGKMTERTDGAWKREFLELRRQLQLRIASVGTAAQQCSAFKEHPELAAELTKRLNKLRSALSIHQANWPVVTIDVKNPGYVESSKNISVATVSFGRLARKIINESRRQPVLASAARA